MADIADVIGDRMEVQEAADIAVINSSYHKGFEMSKCCNNNCRQGRDCPNRRSGVNWPLIGVFAFGFVFWGVVIWAVV